MDHNGINFEQNDCPNKIDNNNYFDETFSEGNDDNFEKESDFNNNNPNETIIEQKMAKIKQNKSNQKRDNSYNSFCLFNEYENHDFGEDKLNISSGDRNKNDYLTVRKLPQCSENEYISIKKKVSTNILEIQN